MVRVTLCFVAGVLIGILSPFSPQYISLVLFCSAAAYLLALFSKRKLPTGLSGLAVVMLLGYCLVDQRTPRSSKDHLVNYDGDVFAYQLVISSYSESRSKTLRTRGDILAVRTPAGWNQMTGSVLLYVPLKDSVEYCYGDVLLIQGRPRQIPSPTNPGGFDFRKFMEYKGIYFQDLISEERVRRLPNDPPNFLLSSAVAVRIWADRQIKSVVVGERERATAAALVLGVTDGLDSELLEAYSSTGALHVLAVSGLHVSIIYWIILLVLKPLDKRRSLKWILAVISVFILWSYAFVSGWSPSVLRAVTMFSFVAFARPWRQTTNIYNTLASSMFCLLLFDPYYIMSVGFQLSYLAVFGIVFLQPKLYALWEPSSMLLDEIWKISSVSIAAQLATLPIGLFYFHQFPTYFLPANLAVIPISFVVLVLGLAVAVFAFADPLTLLLGWLLTWTVRIMNAIIIGFEQLPYSVIDGIYMTPLQCMLLAGLIASAVMLFVQKEFGWLLIACVLSGFFSATQWHRGLTMRNASLIRVYDINGSSVVDHITNRKSTTVADSLSEDDVKKYLRPAWLSDGVRTSLPMPVENIRHGRGYKLWVWHGIPIMQVILKAHDLPSGAVHFVIISNNGLLSVKELSGVKCEKIIVDGSNSIYFAERLRDEALKLGLPLWSVHHDGAFESTHVLR
jgi:competence protein ComEC